MDFVVKTISRILFGVSFVVWLLLALLGTYDREELFHSLYSIGGFFGGIGSGPWNFSLTRTYFGIPVIDLGLVGGFRLPYQGSLHSGFLLPLRTLVPSVAIALLYILASLLLATYAFTLCTGSWLRGEWSRRERARYVSLCVACWLVICYPMLEYLLSEDWYSAVLPYTGFLAVVFALCRAELVRGEEVPLRSLQQSLRLLLAGCYFLLLGHVSMIAVYVWLPALLALWQLPGASRSIRLHWRKLAFEAVLGGVVLVRLLAVMIDVGSELRGVGVPRPIGDWWASPLQGVGAFKHFIGQFIAVENSWLLRELAPEFLGRFNVPAVGLGRLALSVSLLIFGALIVLCSRAVHESRVRVWLWTIVILWFWQFLWMVQVVPPLVRVSASYLMRDSLIVIGALTSITSLPYLLGKSVNGQFKALRHISNLLVLIAFYYAFTTIFVPLTLAESRNGQERPFVSPTSALGSTTRNEEWRGTLDSIAQEDVPLVVLVNSKFPLFPYVVDRAKDDWKGLTGWHQLRQVGIRSWEGFPKLRSTVHLNGDEAPSRLSWLSFELCNADVVMLLRVDKLLVTPEDLGECLVGLRSASAASLPEVTVDAQILRSAGLVMVSLRHRTMFAVIPTESRNRNSVCGVVTEPGCIFGLGQREDVVGVGPVVCTGRCLIELDLSGQQTRPSDRRIVVFPLNAQLPHKIMEVGSDRELPSLAVGGFIGVPVREAAGHRLRVELQPDVRMSLYALAGWSHFLLVIPWLSGFLSRRRSHRETYRKTDTSRLSQSEIDN